MNTAVGKRHLLLAALMAIFIGVGCVALARARPGADRYLDIGILFGTLLGHTTVAAAWTAFGPGRLRWRLPLSLAWIGTLVISLQVADHVVDGTLILGAWLLAQWLALQVPLGGLAIVGGLRIVAAGSLLQRPAQLQFGLRRLLIVTTAIAALLGVGRVVVMSLPQGFGLHSPVQTLVLLAAAAMVMTLPLLLSALLARGAWVNTPLALLAVPALTYVQAILAKPLHVHGPDIYHLVIINAITAGWVLLMVLAVRLTGFELAAVRGPNGAGSV